MKLRGISPLPAERGRGRVGLSPRMIARLAAGEYTCGARPDVSQACYDSIMSSEPPVAAAPRLYAIVAREAPVAVVFRRGPSKWWHILKWDLARLTIEYGTWIKGRLYPRRSAISPDGKLMCYFALNGTWHTYFAVSKLPWLRALCAWTTSGTYTTGCCFYSRDKLGISASLGVEPIEGQFRGTLTDLLPDYSRFNVEIANGWELTSSLRSRLSGDFYELPKSWLKSKGSELAKMDRRNRYTLRMLPCGRGTNQPSIEGHVVTCFLEANDGTLHHLDGAAWADWDQDDRILMATEDGRLLVVKPDRCDKPIWEFDTRDLKPDPQPAPDWAQSW